jgi:hypothetical protein
VLAVTVSDIRPPFLPRLTEPVDFGECIDHPSLTWLSQDIGHLSSHARDSRRRFESLIGERETLLHIAFLSGFAVLARRRRVETDSAFSVLATLLVIGVATASESA